MSTCGQKDGGYFCALPSGHRGGTHESCGGHQWPQWLVRWLRATRATMRCSTCRKPFRTRRRYERHYLAQHGR